MSGLSVNEEEKMKQRNFRARFYDKANDCEVRIYTKADNLEHAREIVRAWSKFEFIDLVEVGEAEELNR